MTGMSSWAIRHPIPPIVLFIVLVLAGIVAFGRLAINETPNVDIPTVSVTIAQPGASASELETQVTRKVEGRIASVAGVKHVTSSISTGTSATTVEFQLDVPTDRALLDVKDAVDRIRAELPLTIEEPVVARQDAVGAPLVTYVVAAPSLSPEELTWYLDDTVARRLRGVRGVGEIARKGGADREIQVQLDPGRLDALGLTADEVSGQLRLTNADLPSGRTETGRKDQTIRTLGATPTAASLAELRIVTRNAGAVRLGAIGRVRDGAAEATQLARLNGTPVIGIEVRRSKGASEVEVARLVSEAVAQLSQSGPNATFTRIATTVDDTLDSYHASLEELLVGALLAAVVVLAFLRDWRATAIAALAMPLSMVPTFAAMILFGFTLNTISLLGLTLVVGILVDDAIVEIENIVRHGAQGVAPYDAALQAADEIGLAVVATTMTLVVVFLPVSFMGGIAGQYFRQFGVTVAVAVLCSLLVARLLTPMLAAYFLKPQVPHHDESRWIRSYGISLSWCLRHRWFTLALGTATFAGSLVLAGSIPSGFIPRGDKNQTFLSLEIRPGATLIDAEDAASALTRALQQDPAVGSVFVTFGAGGSGGGSLTRSASGASLSKGSAVILLVPRKERDAALADVQARLRPRLAEIPDLRVAFLNAQQARDVSVLLVGDDPARLSQAADALQTGMQGLAVLSSVSSTAPFPTTQLIVRPRTAELARLGATVDQVATAIRVATQGDIDRFLPKLTVGARQIPIRVRLANEARDDVVVIGGLKIPTTSGLAPLRLLADVSIGAGEGTIERFDRERKVAIEADLAPGATLGQALALVRTLPAYRDLPPGVRQPLYGDAETMDELFLSFVLAMAAGILMVYVVLVLLFRDFLQPLTIMTALPLSLSGAFAALHLSGMALDVLSLIGLLMLMGIVTKNSILLVEYAIEEIRAGRSRRDALMDAGRKRARPIIMTTVAMIAGMLVPALGLGAGSELRAPMAVVVIGGLLTSTILSLVFVPAAFTVVDDLGRVLRRHLVRLTTRGREERLVADG